MYCKSGINKERKTVVKYESFAKEMFLPSRSKREPLYQNANSNNNNKSQKYKRNTCFY
jgi:hypothetical protein